MVRCPLDHCSACVIRKTRGGLSEAESRIRKALPTSPCALAFSGFLVDRTRVPRLLPLGPTTNSADREFPRVGGAAMRPTAVIHGAVLVDWATAPSNLQNFLRGENTAFLYCPPIALAASILHRVFALASHTAVLSYRANMGDSPCQRVSNMKSPCRCCANRPHR